MRPNPGAAKQRRILSSRGGTCISALQQRKKPFSIPASGFLFLATLFDLRDDADLTVSEGHSEGGMGKKTAAKRGTSLQRYEGMNLLFFLGCILVLGVFVSYVFQVYRTSGQKPPKATDENGIISEVVSTSAESGLFYLGTRLSESSRVYRKLTEVPESDDGLVKGLFAIPGVVEVQVDQRLIVLRKAPSAHWEEIQPGAREIINRHLHMHP